MSSIQSKLEKKNKESLPKTRRKNLNRNKLRNYGSRRQGGACYTDKDISITNILHIFKKIEERMNALILGSS